MNKLILGLAAVAAVAFAVSASAEEQKAAIPSGIFYKGQQANQWLAKDLLVTAKVYNAQGQIIGDIEDLILNDHNEVEGVIMGTGGFLGAGEKKVGVRFSALKIEEKDGKRTILLPEATKEVLDALLPYQRATPPKSLFDRAMEKAKELADKSSETAKDAYQKASEAAKEATEAAKEAYEKAKESTKPKEDAAPAPANKQ